MTTPRLTSQDYLHLRDFLAREFGLFFDSEKVTFLENRVGPIFAAMHCVDMNQFIAGIQETPHRRTELLNAVTTNETWFFRHPRHFDILREVVIPELAQRRRQSDTKKLSFWSAGCSIGAELFSILISARESLPDFEDWRLTLIGSDISSDSIRRANTGVYTSQELKLISPGIIARYFRPKGIDAFEVLPEFRGLVHFERLNLLDPWPQRTFDIVFCRNTMIYFQLKTKTDLTERFFKSLSPDGVFFTSATETLHSVDSSMFNQEFVQGEYIYRKRGNSGNVHVLFRFKTPSDLLRALNLLTRNRIEFHLMSIPQASAQGPRKALHVPKRQEREMLGLLQEADIPFAGREEITV